MGSRQHQHDITKYKHVLVNRNCLAVVLRQASTDSLLNRKSGHELFADFLRQNSACFWNVCLTRGVSGLEYRGNLFPNTLLMSGSDFALEAVRSAWARRVLRPPRGYTIDKLGDVGPVEMLAVPQTHFAPLSEALCRAVSELNEEGRPATADSIRHSLRTHFPEMQLPREDILHKTLGGLIQERKLCHTGEGYFVVSPDTYRQQTLYERPMLMTNDEAILRLHADGGSSLGVQVDEMDIWTSLLHSDQNTTTQSTEVVPSSPHSLKLPRQRCGFNENMKGEKQSMFTKILKRMQSLKKQQVVFSAQFPPHDWSSSGCDVLRCHSVASQTLLQTMSFTPVQNLQTTVPTTESQNMAFQKSNPQYLSPKMSYNKLNSNDWNSRKYSSLTTRQNDSKNLSLYRHSHYSTLPNHSKRRQKHRRNSGEITKVQKNLLNNYQSHSTSSKSNVDNSDDRGGRSSSSGSALAVPIKKSQAVSKNRRLERIKSERNQSKKENVENGIEDAEKRSLLGGMLERIKSDRNPSKKDNVFDSSVFYPSNSLNCKDAPDSQTQQSTTGLPPHPENAAETTSLSKNAPLKNNAPDDTPSPTKLPNSVQKSNDSFLPQKDCDRVKSGVIIKPLILKRLVDMPTVKPSLKEIIIDNTISVEIASKTKSPTTTLVTEETTVTKADGNSKVVTTVTSITTNLPSDGGSDFSSSDKDKSSVNNLNIVTDKSVDCSSTCNIVTGVK